MIGIDIYDCVLVIRTQKALDSFSSHKATLGGEFALVAGAYGSGAAVELGIDRSPVLSYIKSRGLYVGVEAVAQVFIERREENEVMYYWPGVRAGDSKSYNRQVSLKKNLMKIFSFHSFESSRWQSQSTRRSIRSNEGISRC